jgi:hypothetical protein
MTSVFVEKKQRSGTRARSNNRTETRTELTRIISLSTFYSLTKAITEQHHKKLEEVLKIAKNLKFLVKKRELVRFG